MVGTDHAVTQRKHCVFVEGFACMVGTDHAGTQRKHPRHLKKNLERNMENSYEGGRFCFKYYYFI
jgi:hypothetical protein